MSTTNITGADITATYDRYHGTGFYARRYPAPNQACLRRIVELIGTCGNRVLDFGCGDGRYAAPLLDRTEARVLGYDVSHVALRELAERCPRHLADGRLRLAGDGLDHLRQAAGGEPFDVAIAMFGVLGHVLHRRDRVETLSVLRSLLRPGGRLVVTVPNALRRFQAEQEAARALIAAGTLEPGDVLYSREANGETFDLYYHLYRPGELEDELRDAGFRPLATVAESVFPESGVVTSTALRLIDGLARAALPLRFAYGFLTVATPADAPADASAPSAASTAATTPRVPEEA